MKFLKRVLVSLISFILILTCSPTRKLVLEEPQEGKSLVVGAILVENVGIEEVYEAKYANIDVVIVGRFVTDGNEKTEGFRVKTDKNGYFALPNVPPGSYIVKGIVIDIAYNTHLLIGSRWEGNTQIFQPVDNMIDYSVSFFPPSSDEKIIDLNILYMQIDQATRIFDQIFKSLNNKTLNLPDVMYTMLNPVIYFQQKYPDWGWFK